MPERSSTDPMTTVPEHPAPQTAPVPHPAAPAPIRDEATRRTELKAMKRMATGLLGVALVIFVIARIFEPAYPWLGFVRATAEASLVGGLADWFAVTALFRHPLGIPIPHTAIIQTQKERIGRVLGGFVQNHFLSHDVLAARIASMRLSERVARWLSDPEESSRLARHLAAGVAQAVQAMPEEEIRALIRDAAVTRLQAVQLAPMVGNLLSVVAADDRHQVLLDEALKLVRDSLEQNRDELRQKIREESPWWVPGAVDNAFQRKLEAATQRLIEEVQADPQHPLRIRFDAKFRDFIDRLKHSPEVAARAETLKGNLLDHPAVEEFASSLWDRARSAAERFTADAGQPTLEPLTRGISAVGISLAADAGRRAELDEFLTTFLASVLERHRQDVGELIAETVRQWDPEVAAQRLELAVGRDLQFIRLNGTLVGGLAGLIIYTISFLFR